MPLTPKGEEIKSALVKEYGPEKGEQVLYAGKNAGTFTGIDGDGFYQGAPVHEVTGHAGTIDAGRCGMDAIVGDGIVAWGQPYGINASEAGGPPLTPDLHKAVGI